MSEKSRFDMVENGMHFNEVKKLFGDDMWQHKGFPSSTWLVNNEADKNSDHGNLIEFDGDMRVKSKGGISCA